MSIWDYTLTFTANSVKEKGCISVPDYSRFALDPNQTGTIQLTLLGINSGFINYNRIDATKTPFYPFITAGNNATGFPFPMLQITPKATTTFDMSVSIQQSVHLYQQSTVISDRIIETGPSRPSGPSLGPLVKKDPSLTIKKYEKKETPDDKLADLITKRLVEIAAERKFIEAAACGGACDYDYLTKKQATQIALPWKDLRAEWKDKSSDPCAEAKSLAGQMSDVGRKQGFLDKIETACEIFENRISRIAAELPDEGSKKQEVANDYLAKCRPDMSTVYLDGDTRIDFLALKRMLDNVVERQEQALHRGVPNMTLSSVNLSSAFQITMEAQAGTQHFFRIVPVLVPPNTDLKIDHTHTLKVSLNGKKNKDAQSTKRLVESCRERVSRPVNGRPDEPDVCASEYGQLLEGVIQALERSQ